MNKKQIKEVIELLEDLVAEMECKGIEEIRLSANTYMLGNNFLATYKGYLPLEWNSLEERLYED